MATTWNNSDGLFIAFGTTEGTSGTTGEFSTLGARRVEEFTINDMTTLTTSAVVLDQFDALPKNAFIEQVDIITDTAVTSGGSATLTIGLVKDDRTTAYSATGLVNALAVATIATLGTTTSLTVGSTGAGASLGVALTEKAYISAKYTTAAFTAGKITVRVHYSFVAS